MDRKRRTHLYQLEARPSCQHDHHDCWARRHAYFCGGRAFALNRTVAQASCCDLQSNIAGKSKFPVAMSKAILQQIEDAVKTKGAELVKQAGAVFQLVVGDNKLHVDLKNGNGAVKWGELAA